MVSYYWLHPKRSQNGITRQGSITFANKTECVIKKRSKFKPLEGATYQALYGLTFGYCMCQLNDIFEYR